jgi:hypothetical protein
VFERSPPTASARSRRPELLAAEEIVHREGQREQGREGAACRIVDHGCRENGLARADPEIHAASRHAHGTTFVAVAGAAASMLLPRRVVIDALERGARINRKRGQRCAVPFESAIGFTAAP